MITLTGPDVGSDVAGARISLLDWVYNGLNPSPLLLAQRQQLGRAEEQKALRTPSEVSWLD